MSKQQTKDLTPFPYNAQGRRASKTAGGVTTNYLYDGNKLIAEKDGSGSLIASYFYDDKDQLVSVNRGGANYYYHYDAHGDVTRITDQSGSVVASYDYDAWGNITSSSGTFANSQPFRYGGYFYDSETGLYYLINRYYDPSIGRFISKDPRGTISPPDSLAANPYLYVKNNPLNATDPDGLGGLGAIYGRVMNTAGSPIVGAAVRWCFINIDGGNYILPGNANVVGTNGAGEYRFPVYEGIYHVYFDAAGYVSQVQQYLTVYAGQELVAATVIMQPAVSQPSPGPAPSPGPSPAPGPAPEPAPTQPTQPSPTPTTPQVPPPISTSVWQFPRFQDVTAWFTADLRSHAMTAYFMRLAPFRVTLGWWVYMNWPVSGPYDYKHWMGRTNEYLFLGVVRRGEDLGNLHYGYVGRAAGFSLTLLHGGAGAIQIMVDKDWDFYREWRERLIFFFDEPRDYNMITYGYSLRL